MIPSKKQQAVVVAKFMAPFIDLLTSAVGRENALKAREINDVIGLPTASLTNGDFREVRLLASAALKSCGVLVCSGNDGYWLPTTREEVHVTETRLRAASRALTARANAMHAAAEAQWPTQPSLI